MKLSFFSKYVIFSVILFLIILIVGSISFLFSMQQIIRDNKVSELTKLLEIEKIKLETSVNKEISIVLKMAGSYLIQNYFENPTNPVLKKLALDEIKSYRRALAAGATIFWVNDVDKLFYSDDKPPYKVDITDTVNYWYLMTLNETEDYNFNINYNPNLNVTNIWINAPVFNKSRKPIGMLGSGIDLSAFVKSVYMAYSSEARLYFFNSLGEITGAKNIELVASKKNINEEFRDINEDIFAKANSLKSGETQTFSIPNGQATIISIPLLNWYAVAALDYSINDFKIPITAFFFVVILVIAFILIITCIFVFRLIKSLQLATVSIEEQNKIIMAGIRYANKIQRNLLPPDRVLTERFSDYSVIWEPRDVVGGDIYWVKHFEKGSVLCVCDCTGHGTPGALLTMLVASALESAVDPSNCDDTVDIIWRIDESIKGVFNVNDLEIKDGCDLAVLFIANDGSVRLSSGHISIFICDGKQVQRIKGQKIFVGEGNLKDKNDIETIHIPFDPENKFYIASDGLFDQPGGEYLVPFGYKRFEKLILESHAKKHSEISAKIWVDFEGYRGAEPRVDDFELITFKPYGGRL